MAWRIESPGRFYDAGEDKVVYFQPDSGDTHLLSDFTAHVIAKLAGQEMATEELINLIKPDLDPDDCSAFSLAIPDILDELVALDIVERD